MYAIIEAYGKQYRVQKGETILIDRVEMEPSQPISFPHVLLVNHNEQTHVGTPHVSGCKVLGEVLGEEKGEKVIAYKYKKRKNYRRKIGHRQKYSKIKITDIQLA